MVTSDSSLVLKISVQYLVGILGGSIAACIGLLALPWRVSGAGCGTAALAWAAYVFADGSEFSANGRHDPNFSKNDWMLSAMRSYLQMSLHRVKEVQSQLVARSATGVGQAIFATFPHGVNGDFRVLLDGMLPEAFPKVAPVRALAASILFRIPGIRSWVLRTGCVDAGRKTAKKVLSNGLSLMVLPGGLDEQLCTIHGRERVYLQKRFGFVKLAMEHGVPLVPVYVFGCSDLYFTSSLFLGIRKWIVRALRIALPLYWGRWGFIYYPSPKGFPLPVAQNIVFGDPIVVPHKEKPTQEEIAAEHAKFVAALTALFDAHKAHFGVGDRSLEVL